jgi:CheY-like chemotaxis protein
MSKSLSVLVVEDDPVVRAMVGMVLESAGHAAVGLGGALGASEIMKLEPFDLIITDVLMPKMDGVAFIREVRLKWPGLPIIAISGDGDRMAGSRRLQSAIEAGATTTLAKPFENKVLLALIDKVAAQNPRGAR